MKLRSLFLAVAGASILTTAFTPRANADCDSLLVYFNFEDGTLPRKSPPTPGIVDFASDQTVATGGDNPGGGIQMSTLTTNYTPGQFDSISSLIPIGTENQSAGDIDHPPLHAPPGGTPGIAVNFTVSSNNNNKYIQFAVNATFFTDMSLSYAVNTNGNGFSTQTWQYSITAGHADNTFVQFAQFTGLTGLQTLGPTLLGAATNNQPDLVIRIVFSGGQSNGQDDQTIIDNIQLTGCVVPEPATVGGGLLGVVGLCWFQRRRIRLILPRLRRT
jgi:PEP-CTERM motif.